MGKIFNKGFNKDEDKKEGLLKRLKNIEDKNKARLKEIEDHQKKQLDTDSKSLKSISYFSQLSTKAKELFEKIKKEKNEVDAETFVCVKTDVTVFNFNKFKNSIDLASNIYRNKNLLKDAENEQYNIKILLYKLRNYNPTKPKNKKAKKETSIAVEKLLNNRQEVIYTFKTGIFPYIDGFQIKEESEEKNLEKIKYEIKKIIKYIQNESKGINYDLFKDYFNFVLPSALARKIYETKYKKKNNKLVEVIKNRWSNLKDGIKKMSEDDKVIKKPNKILQIVKEVLEFN